MQGGLDFWQGGLDLQQVGLVFFVFLQAGKILKVAVSAALEPTCRASRQGPRTKVNAMSKEDISEKKIEVAMPV